MELFTSATSPPPLLKNKYFAAGYFFLKRRRMWQLWPEHKKRGGGGNKLHFCTSLLCVLLCAVQQNSDTRVGVKVITEVVMFGTCWNVCGTCPTRQVSGRGRRMSGRRSPHSGVPLYFHPKLLHGRQRKKRGESYLFLSFFVIRSFFCDRHLSCNMICLKREW